MEIVLEPAANGQATIRIGGRYAHSRRDPGREAVRSMSETIRRDPPAVVFLGAGLGYQPAAVLAGTERTRVIVFEPESRVRDLALEHGPLGSSDDRLTVVGSLDALTELLSEIARDGFDLYALPATAETDPIHAAELVVRNFADRLDINRNTLNRFGRLWVRNLTSNLPAMARARGVNELQGVLKGVPALLLAAGPTLDSVLPLLPELSRRMAVIAVDTAIQPALGAGVVPDIAVVVDPQYWNARHLDRAYLKQTLLVSEPSAHPSVFEHFRDPPLLCSSLFPLARFFESSLGAYGNLGAGGSVATSGWDLARITGCPRICVAGLDLGFPGGRTHVRGSFFEHLALIRGTTLSPAERVVFRYTWGAQPTPVDANDGGTLLSDRRMAVYRNWFTGQLRTERAPETVTITPGSAEVPGIELRDPADLLQLADARRRVNDALDRIKPRAHSEIYARTEIIADAKSAVSTGIAELRDLGRAARRLIEAYQDTQPKPEPFDFSRLSEIDAAIGTHPAREVASFLMQDVIARIDNGFGSASQAEQMEASIALYTALEDGATFIHEKLGR